MSTINITQLKLTAAVPAKSVTYIVDEAATSAEEKNLKIYTEDLVANAPYAAGARPINTFGGAVDDATAKAANAAQKSELAAPTGAGEVGTPEKTVQERLDWELKRRGDFVDRVISTSPIRGSYAIKGQGRTWFGVGTRSADKAAEFTFQRNVDDLALVEFGVRGAVRASTTLVKASNFRTASDVPVNIADIPKAADNAYFTSAQIGYKLDIPFNGTGLTFWHNKNPQGGYWEVTVDGTIVRYVSCWNAAIGVSAKTDIVQGLAPGSHTAVFKFLGADPAHVPDAGGPRGWFKWDDGSLPTQDAGIISDGTELALDYSTAVIAITNIIEFAMQARHSGASWARDWVPSHAMVAGATQTLNREIYLDGYLLNDALDTMPAVNEVAIGNLMIRQRYRAFNTNDTTKAFPLWDGTLIQKFDRGVLHISNEFVTTRDIDFGNAYQPSVSARNTSAPNFIGDSGFASVTTGVDRSFDPGDMHSAMFYGDAGIAIAISPLSAYESTSRAKPWQALSATRLTDRLDGFGKIYWNAVRTGSIVPAGTRLTSEARIAFSAFCPWVMP